ncbi:FAD-dependent oxidoreductase [Arthrobacter glacialis]|uniref:FAD-dependent oxidoreductase n=1 Tax=Arthrobacter glacialis TaxID=1664 RepID=UPI000CD45C48|nr:FAD-dependent oxidoreductase [Arthrobacter glacialis]POH57862.1 FAD-dependent oxidoreductase [Arthrobacter glacialis]
MVTQVDVVVVGGGVMGSAAARAVAQSGKSVALLEQFAAGHQLGASHGTTRNFNTAYREPEYLALVTEARALWDGLSHETGTQLLDLVGLVNHGNVEPLLGIKQSHESLGIDSEFLSAEQASERWAGMTFRSDVLFVPESGRVRAAEALAALRTSAETGGAQFHYESPVRDIIVHGDHSVRVITDTTEFLAERVIVTAGAWTHKVLSQLMELPPLVVTQEQPAHFQPLDASVDWPSFNHSPDPRSTADDYWYSPTYGMFTPGEGVKIGWHGVGPVVDPDSRDFLPEAVQLAALQRYANEWFPGLDATACEPISCTYTSTESENFILDRFGPVVVGAGFSGHGYKFAPAIGRVLADLADGKPAPALFRA